MGTRSNTIIIDEDKPLINMYRQMDGYPSGHGAELAQFLAPIKMVNGLGGDPGPVANGGGCLAAQMIAHFKDGPGHIYVGDIDDESNDYTYRVRVYTFDPSAGIQIEVLSYGDKVFEGGPEQFTKFCTEYGA